jgi:hypothetical protein
MVIPSHIIEAGIDPVRWLAYSLDGRRYELFCRITERIRIDPHSGCWIWQGGDSGSGRGGGYGRISIDGQMMAVHRVMYQIVHGPIHMNRQVDHVQPKCTSRLCCNPDHLEAVTHKQNQRRRRRT